MELIRLFKITTIVFVFHLTANGQVISKKESAAIDVLLTESSEQHKPTTYIIQNASILTMKDSAMVTNTSVLIEDAIIQEIGTDIQNQNAIIIDGTDKFLMPGLTDMHVHLFENHPMKNTWMIMLLINGVTSVRDMCGEPGKLRLRDEIERNEILAPNIYQAGPIINGKTDKSGLFEYASSPEQGRKLVLRQNELGYDFIKVYDDLSIETYAAIADEAHHQGMLVTGHIPDNVTLEDALKLNQNSIEHLTGYFEWKDNQVDLSVSDNYASLTANAGAWNCPTIYNHYLNGSKTGVSEIMEYVESSGLFPSGLRKNWKNRLDNPSKEIIEIIDEYGASNFASLRNIVLSLYNSKAKLIAGTDAGNLPFLIPGYSLHQELRMMNEFGIPIYEVLKMATINAALAMKKDDEFGTVEAGKRADLLLLNSNPLDHIENLQDRNGVMVRGIWLSEEELNKLRNKVKLGFDK